MSTAPRVAASAGVVLAAVISGLLFGAVFGVSPLVVPVVVPAAAVLVVAVGCGSGPAAADWRPLLAAGAGLLAVVETVLWPTTVAGLPTARTLHLLGAGATESWQLTLQSTWPARPEPALLLFVPLLVVTAAVFGVELLHRLAGPLIALTPSLALLLLAQLYAPLPAGPALGVALLYATIAGGLVLAARDDVPRVPRIAAQAAPAAAAMLVVALLVPVGPAYSLRQDRSAPVTGPLVASPLDEIARRLRSPQTPVFRFDSATRVDRWPLVVLDEFDGVSWTPGGRYRRLGRELPVDPSVRVPAPRRSADVTILDVGGPWLPSQTWPAAVDGVEPLVAQQHGSLRRQDAGGTLAYTLHWWEPQPDPRALADAAVATDAPGGLVAVGQVPPEVFAMAEGAVRGIRPSFRAALVLEDFLRRNYRPAAVGRSQPTGYGWPQLSTFLLRSHQGTSGQFAAAYVVMARIVGIPARLAVGYRTPAAPDPDGTWTVRNGNVLAWPEVAVQGVGWVPLDPTGTTSTRPGRGSLADAAQQARVDAAAEGTAPPPPAAAPPPSPPTDRTTAGRAFPLPLLLLLPALPLAGWAVGVPAAWAVRSRRRRRRPGPGAVVGAWEEVRDRLRAHGVVTSPAMTVRDLAAAATLTGYESVAAVRRLGHVVDRALFAGATVDDRHAEQAWAAVHTLRTALARRGRRDRLRAMFDVRGLRRPR